MNFLQNHDVHKTLFLTHLFSLFPPLPLRQISPFPCLQFQLDTYHDGNVIENASLLIYCLHFQIWLKIATLSHVKYILSYTSSVIRDIPLQIEASVFYCRHNTFG